jgi:hypothetical protein
MPVLSLAPEVEMDEERDARWQAILEAQAEIVDQPVSTGPAGGSAGRARTRGRSSSKSIQFNEALSGLGSWSTVQHTERRLSA